MLMENVPDGTVKILLDEKGKQFSSREFSSLINRTFDDGKNISLLIGGADGHDKTIIKSDYTISLGNMTWPHMLVRVMLAEQLYRAYSILISHPYHRD